MYRAKHLRKGKNSFKRMTAFFLAAAILASVVFTGFSATVLPVTVQAAENDGGLSEHVIDTVSPNHVKFNLFDYWLEEQDTTTHTGRSYWQAGINKGHSFIFGSESDAGPWNAWTGNDRHYNDNDPNSIKYGVYAGVAETTLTDGYPKLSLWDDYYEKDQRPTFIPNNGLLPTLTESLDYLFNPNIVSEYKVSYENVQGLVKYDGNGGYVYNSHENYAAFKKTSGMLGTNGELSGGYFEVYDNWALTSSGSPNGQFFPFDGADEVFERDGDGKYKVNEETGTLVPNPNVPLDGNTPLNHYIGMTMETVFLQPEDGMIDANTPMYFTFSGDDDVWIFIDGVLVSDLGGIHDECFTMIDFETGTVYTGLTPMIKNSDGKSFSEAMPTLEELKDAENGAGPEKWTWCNRGASGKPNISGTYDEYKAAHGIQTTTLRTIFETAGQATYQTWGTGTMSADTFDQNTQHELKMFYLERGAGASNLVLSFNMLAVPASGVTKTDQDGNPVPGVEFELWPAQVDDTKKDENGNPAPVTDPDTGLYVADESAGTPICRATTDENGHLNFITDTRKIISFQERAQASDPQFYYVLKESGRPVGYRSKGDISLYYSIYNNHTKEGVLLSYNYWQTGAYTQAKLDVTMTNKLYQYDLDSNGYPTAGPRIAPNHTAEEDDIREYLDNGILFAVPIKRMDMGESLYEDTNFHALYGTSNTGWTVMTENISDKASVLEAAQNMERVMQETRQTGTIIAERNARQLFHVEVTNIPGDVKLTYPYLLETGGEEESQYNIAFYFAPNADSLDDITEPDTIVRISTVTLADGSGEVDRFERQYASQFYVPNIFNRVRVQKMNYYGERLGDTEFTMYQAYSYQAREGYVKDESKGLYRNPDVVNANGTLKTRTEIRQTTPWDQGETRQEGATGTGGLDLDGALIFPTKFDQYVYTEQLEPYRVNENDTSTYMEEGEYVIFETKAPAGYEVNEAPIRVTVNSDGVFADAGEVNDGIRTGQYAGWIVNSMAQFATEGVVDETLTFINSTLQVLGEDGSLKAPIEGTVTWMYKYSNENDRYIRFAEDIGRYATAGRNLYQYTDAGTPRLVITQNTDVTAKVIVFDGDYEDCDGTVIVNKKNLENNSIYTMEGIATNGTLAFWLRKATEEDAGQTLESVEIDGKILQEGVDYHVYTPNVNNLSEYEDLSGLFSVETLVQVYDQGYGSLSVTKETENTPKGSAVKNELFHFRVYSVFENATKVILAKTDENGETAIDSDTGQPVIKEDFNGTLNVRLRQKGSEGQASQDTATNIAVDFKNGVGMFYLQPDYDAEFVYIPENRDHEVFKGLNKNEGVVGLVETRITLSNTEQNGSGVICAHHVAFDGQAREDAITFENGIGTFYRNPDYEIRSVTFEDGKVVYTIDGKTNTLTVENRIQYTTLENILNVPVDGEVDVDFTETDGSPSSSERILVNDDLPPENNDFGSVHVGDGEVTVYEDTDGDGYKMAYSLSSGTYSATSVAQFALHSGQTIRISQLPAGATYYVYEYAVGDGNRNITDWDTKVTGGGEAIEGYRAAKGTIALNDGTSDEQSIIFTNSAHVGQLTVSKTVTGNQATEADREKDFSFTVTLKDSAGNPLTGIYSYTGSAIDGAAVLTLDNNGTATFQLSHGQSITIQEIPKDATYEVQETNSDGYTVILNADGDDDGIAEGTIAKDSVSIAAFTNLKLSTLSFTKVAAENRALPLAGAEFKLYRLKCTDPDNHNHAEDLVNAAGDCWSLVNTLVSDDDGGVSFGDLMAGSEYRLVESKAPEGRVLPEGQWKITTDSNNAIAIEAIAGQNGRLPLAFAEDGGKWLLPNAKPISLPSFGGFGATPFLMAGGVLMLMAAVGFVLIKKQQHKRTSSK